MIRSGRSVGKMQNIRENAWRLPASQSHDALATVTDSFQSQFVFKILSLNKQHSDVSIYSHLVLLNEHHFKSKW